MTSRTRVVEWIVAVIGCAIVAIAIAADQAWFDRHFLPGFFFTRADYVRVEWIARIAAMLAGAALAIVLRRPLARRLSAHPDRFFSAAIAVVLAFFCAELTIGPMWSIPMDVAPRYSGTASGLMNTGSAVAAIISPIAFGYIVDWTGNWQLPFIGSLGLLLVGAAMAFTMHPERAFEPDSPATVTS